MEAIIKILNIIGSQNNKRDQYTNLKMGLSSASSTSSKLSSEYYHNILESLKCFQNRPSTLKNYHQIWNQFNKFLIRLDNRPNSWEERLALYGAHLIKKGSQSLTIKSYASAVKKILQIDGYPWNNDKFLFSTVTKVCKFKNDRLRVRLPIQMGLLEILLFEIERMYDGSSPKSTLQL